MNKRQEMPQLCRFLKLATGASVAALILSSCAFAPGMEFSENSAINSDNPDAIPVVLPITPALIERLTLESRPPSIDDLLSVKSHPYQIGAADVLSIVVWDHPELVMPNLTYSIGATSGDLPTSAGMAAQTLPGYAVSADGFVQFPYINAVKVGGMTELQAKQVLTRQLSKYITDPQVTVRVIGYRSQKVYIDGAVTTAGVKSITDMGMTVADIINQGGGVSSIGNRNRVMLTRQGKTYRIDLSQLARAGISPAQINLLNNDVVYVPPLQDERVSVMGEVTKPAAVPFKSDGRLTLNDALTDAGGVLGLSSDPKAIYVIRSSGDPAEPFVFHLDAKNPSALGLAQQFALKPNDVVYVDAPGLVRWSRIISLLTGSATSANAVRNVLNN